MSEYFLIGEIKSVINSNGFVSIKSYSDFPDKVLKLKEVFVDIFGDKRRFIIENIEYKKSFFVFKFKNFDSLETTEILVGKKIFVDNLRLPKLSSFEFFIHDLIGSKVYLENEFFGELIEVLQLPANDVYVVNSKEGKEVLVPAVKKIIKSFDSANKILIISSDFDYLEDEN